VKAGVFLLVRFWPVMSGTDAWFWIVTFSGLITLIIGAYAALFDLARAGLRLIAVTGRPLGFAEVAARMWPIAAAVDAECDSKFKSALSVWVPDVEKSESSCAASAAENGNFSSFSHMHSPQIP